MTTTIYILNGPNLNLLGQRQPEIYGHETLADVERRCAAVAAEKGFSVRLFQSNHEGAIVDQIHEARQAACGIVINRPPIRTPRWRSSTRSMPSRGR